MLGDRNMTGLRDITGWSDLCVDCAADNDVGWSGRRLSRAAAGAAGTARTVRTCRLDRGCPSSQALELRGRQSACQTIRYRFRTCRGRGALDELGPHCFYQGRCTEFPGWQAGHVRFSSELVYHDVSIPRHSADPHPAERNHIRASIQGAQK